MSTRFFIPTQATAFFQDNPALRPPLMTKAEEERLETQPPGLRMAPRCISCDETTDERVTFQCGLRKTQASGAAIWEQEFCLCAPCQRTRDIIGNVNKIFPLGLLAIALFCTTQLPYEDWGLWQGGGILLGTLALTWLAGQMLSPTIRRLIRQRWDKKQVKRYHGFALHYFYDPRKGEHAWILCLDLDSPTQAERFAQDNPHAISDTAWNASYERIREA